MYLSSILYSCEIDGCAIFIFGRYIIMDSRKLNSRNSRRNSKATKSVSSKMRKTSKKSIQSTVQPKPVKTIRLKAMPTVSLGNIPPGHVSNIKFASEQQLIDFVNNEITNGPQIVSIPVPPQRHAFLVDVQPDKIMVSDWGGQNNKTVGLEYISGRENTNYAAQFEQYSDLMIKLEERYERPIEYYAVDKELLKASKKFSKECGGNGGCSNYIYAWVKKHYPEYK